MTLIAILVILILACQVWDNAARWTAAVSGLCADIVKGYQLFRMFNRDVVSDYIQVRPVKRRINRKEDRLTEVEC